jgi:hypothetical protein
VRGSDGTTVWRFALAQDYYSSVFYALALDARGDVFAGGAINARVGTIKFSGSTGATLWQRMVGSGSGYSGTAVRSMRADQNGDVIVTGHEWISNGRYQAYSAKYAGSDGAVRWEQRITNPSSSLTSRELALDANGNAIVALDNGLLCKYDGTSGAELWRQQGPAIPYDLIVDPAGDVFVANSTYTTDYAQGASLAKYSGVSGTLRWSRTQSLFGSEFFCSLLSRNGEILVAGQRSDDLLLSAVDPTTGARRWDVTYGASNVADRMSNTYRPKGRIALQPDGGVVITGCSQGVGAGFDFATLRYAPGPGIKSGGISWILPTSARLFTKAMDNGSAATLAWEYGPTTAYGSITEPVQIKPSYPNNNPYPNNSTWDYIVPYYTTITGLPENTTIHARAVAMSNVGTTYGEDLVFTTSWDANRDHLPDEWELANWGGTSVHSATGDDDRDGLKNLLEYALGRNPRVPDFSDANVVAPVGDYLTATISKQPFVTYAVEASSDLQTWGTADTTTVVDDPTTLVVRSNHPISGGGTHFLRIRVTAQ